MTLRLPLEGISVVAIEQAVAAPFCTARLADAGARVVKVERPEGDFARGYDDAVAGGQSSYFVWLNRGKESRVLDLATEAGRDGLRGLIADADILVQNLKPGALDRMGFGIEDLCRADPCLIACSIGGYGDEGPLANRKAYDLLIQAESGLSSITGGPDEPARVGISVVDIATGATAHAAILEALIARGRSGEGADIRVSMFDVMADWLTVPLLHQEGGRPPQRAGLAHPSIAPYGVFVTREGKRLLISIQSEREWARFCTLFLREPDAIHDPRFATNLARTRHREETDGMVAAVFTMLDEAEAVARLTQADIAFAAVNDMAALSRHPHLRRITVDTPHGPVAYPAPAPILRGIERRYGPVPALGEQGGALGQDESHRALNRLRAVLDTLAERGKHLAVWWRDDDAVAATPALDRLLALAERHAAPILIAAIPAGIEPSLGRSVEAAPGAWFAVHGLAHANHAPADSKPAEFGPHRPLPILAAEAAEALRLARERLPGDRLLPVFVPPWNRFAPDLAAELPGLGYEGLSATPGPPVPGLIRADIHLDPIDWRGTHSLSPPEALVDSLIRTIAAEPGRPLGLLTHHLAHDAAIWAFLDGLLALLSAHPAVHFLDPRRLFDTAADAGGEARPICIGEPRARAT